MLADIAADLGRAVDISKRVADIALGARQMQLYATNAIVLTRARGVSVPGFEAVSEQMAQVSRQLGALLGSLRARTTAWIGSVSGLLSVEREITSLSAAATSAPHASAQSATVVAPMRAELAARTGVERDRRALVLVVDDLRQLAAAGCVLARTAKIEATYGNSLAAELGETADAFTRIADSVDDYVRTIARWLAAARTTGGNR